MEEKNNIFAAADSGEYLAKALNGKFYSILRVDPQKNRVLVLHSRDYPQAVNTEMDWNAYMSRYGAILTAEGQERLRKRLSSEALLSEAKNGEVNFYIDISYLKENQTNWLTVSVLLEKNTDGAWFANMFIWKSNSEHLMRSIIDMYVYETCDYFIYLDVRNNSFVMFNGNPLETSRIAEVSDDYEKAAAEYTENFVVEEDKEMVVRKMSLKYIIKQLENNKVYSFTTGVIDPVRGYTRKQLTYRYYDRQAGKVLLCRNDVTEIYLEERARQRELEAARLKADTDPLTGLFNYGGISRRVDDLLLKKEKLSAMLVLDLDNFKQVNDSLGHQEGDHLLWKVAQALQLQNHGTYLCGRVGGDEFVVFLYGIDDKKQAEETAYHICETVKSLTLPENLSGLVSCSIGGAFAPEEGTDYRELFKSADRRTYQAKRLGKNRFLMEDMDE